MNVDISRDGTSLISGGSSVRWELPSTGGCSKINCRCTRSPFIRPANWIFSRKQNRCQKLKMRLKSTSPASFPRIFFQHTRRKDSTGLFRRCGRSALSFRHRTFAGFIGNNGNGKIHIKAAKISSRAIPHGRCGKTGTSSRPCFCPGH